MSKKILISVTSIRDIGGISSSVINLLNEICNIYDVSLSVLSNYISPNVEIPSQVKIIQGSNYLRDIIISRSLLSSQSLFQKVKRNIRRIIHRFITKDTGVERALDDIKVTDYYDAAIAFSDYEYNYSEKKCYDYYFILNCVNASVKTAWIHNDPIKLGWTYDLVMRRLKSFDYIINVSNVCKSIFDSIAPELIAKSKVVYNLYDIENIKQKALLYKPISNGKDKINLVTVARIEIKQKRIDRIINVVERLMYKGYSNFSWVVVGDGRMLEEFKKIIKDKNLTSIIKFVGIQSNPFPYILNSDAFILCSEYEGFGMTIKEAQILKIPTFSTCYGAIHEVIENGKQGEVCENSTEGLYYIVKSILDNPNKLKKYKQYLADHPINNSIGLRQFNEIVSIPKVNLQN